jgi:cysteinyl-tRNA synthetase
VVGESAKRNPSDFVLWKPAKPGEPAWPSPFGEGRPGWHTECVAMSTQILGERFHLHAGGQDLRFPHHENERAQAVALGLGFADHWMHHEFVVDPSGEKMSKSLGNFDNMVEFLDQSDPRSLRLLLLQAHYRSPVRLDRDAIARAERTLDGLDAFLRRSATVPAEVPDAAVIESFTSQLDDDFDTPGASALLFDTMRRANAALDTGGAEGPALVAAVTEMLKAVGLRERAAAIPPDVLEQVAALDAARAGKDFATADRIRAELRDAGWTVETTPQGTRVSR